MVELVLGGARSGKSNFAESRLSQALTVTYIATIDAAQNDAEMAQRILRHQQDRPAHWQTVEAPHDVPGAIARCKTEAILIDCLTGYLANGLMAAADTSDGIDAVADDVQQLVDAVQAYSGRLVIVSNEVGFGVVPDNALARRFRDAVGYAHQRIASVADYVWLLVAGIPTEIKSP